MALSFNEKFRSTFPTLQIVNVHHDVGVLRNACHLVGKRVLSFVLGRCGVFEEGRRLALFGQHDPIQPNWGDDLSFDGILAVAVGPTSWFNKRNLVLRACVFFTGRKSKHKTKSKQCKNCLHRD